MLAAFNYTLIAFSALYFIYLFWQIVSWVLAPEYPPTQQNPETKVSVIIPCRNEEDNISKCIESILKQNYPSHLFEIIIADDCSEDNTKKVAEETLKKSSLHWKYVKVAERASNKKKAITAGIHASAGDLIIITDADCITPENWVRSIVSLYQEKNYQLICGPVEISKGNTFCEKFQELEVCGLSMLTGAGIFSKKPLLANGANIAYTRKAFDAVNGFREIDSIPTGDDTLLLFKINKHFPGQIGYLKNKSSAIYTHAQPTWNAFLQQRIRWASKGFISKNPLNSFISFLVFITNFMLLVYGVGSLVYFSLNWVFVNCLIAKFTIDFLLLTCATGFFRKKRLLWCFLPAELVTMVYMSWVGLTASFSGYHWKGRDY